jgi:DNA polymerase III epsilon subunit family exonuclease
MPKVKENELRLGDTLADGARVVGRQRRGLLLARPGATGFSRELRFIFSWPDGSPRDVQVSARLDPCEVCGQGQGVEGHELCRSVRRGPSLSQAVDHFLTLGAQLLEPAAIGSMGPWHPSLANVEFTVFDTETTGLHRKDDRVIELAAIRCSVRGEIARFETFIDPGFHIPETASEINGIYDEDVEGAPDESEAMRDFARFVRGSVLVAHNLEFDASFLEAASQRHDINFEVKGALDTLRMARGKPGKTGLISRKETESFKLTDLTALLGIPHRDAHRAMSDVEGTVGLLDVLLKRKYEQQLQQGKS